ncbi:MAG: ChaN family lipoprotein [Candidatus Aminicenantes bacterium]
MKKLSLSLLLLPLLFHSSNLITLTASLSKFPQHQKQELIRYLESHRQSPEDYIIDKFQDYDLVFIGEAHLIKHDVELIQALIPRLHQAGVYNLAMEFGCAEHQDKVDALITADIYDEDLARWLLFKWGSYWPYIEYMEIYRRAWELNRSLPPDAPKFRILHLDYRPRWNLTKKGKMTARRYKRIFYKGDRDKHMAKILHKELVKKNKKALIYAGAHHAFTRFNLPNYDFKRKQLLGHHKDRMGNVIFQKVPHKVFNICLHYPWPSQKSLNEFVYPVDGAIDQVMAEFDDQRIGFDVKDSPFGLLQDNNIYYSLGYDDFTLGRFCDGYIYQRPISGYEGCTVDRQFITEENFKEAIDYLPNPRLKELLKNPQHFLSFMQSKADMTKRFEELK